MLCVSYSNDIVGISYAPTNTRERLSIIFWILICFSSVFYAIEYREAQNPLGNASRLLTDYSKTHDVSFRREFMYINSISALNIVTSQSINRIVNISICTTYTVNCYTVVHDFLLNYC